MKARSGAMILIGAVCALAASCARSRGHGDASAGSAGKGGSGGPGVGGSLGDGGAHSGTGGGSAGVGEGGNPGGGEGGSGDVGGVDAMRRARCEALCTISPPGNEWGEGAEPGETCGRDDECVEAFCSVKAGRES